MELPTVIIVGQDPYPIKGVATGLAFAVNEDIEEIPPSLQIMLDELALNYYHDITFDRENIDVTLNHWKDQGVLLLNASLTCDVLSPEGVNKLFEKGSHSNYWREILMEKLFFELNNELNECVFVFMGQKAQYYNKYIDPEKHCVINVVHPVSDHRSGNENFRGSKVFNRINDYLTSKNKEEIKWAN
jgi:uracil-DNA glycosylase